jgi:hypothetical protein
VDFDLFTQNASGRIQFAIMMVATCRSSLSLLLVLGGDYRGIGTST